MALLQTEVAYEAKINWDELQPNHKEELSPYDKFYFHAVRDGIIDDRVLRLLYTDGDETPYGIYQKYMSEFNISVSDFYISTKDFEKLERLEIKYWSKKRRISQREIKRAYISMHNLNHSPAEFKPRKPRWAKYGYVYIKELISKG